MTTMYNIHKKYKMCTYIIYIHSKNLCSNKTQTNLHAHHTQRQALRKQYPVNDILDVLSKVAGQQVVALKDAGGHVGVVLCSIYRVLKKMRKQHEIMMMKGSHKGNITDTVYVHGVCVCVCVGGVCVVSVCVLCMCVCGVCVCMCACAW